MTKINSDKIGNHINCDGCGDDIANHIARGLRNTEIMEYVFKVNKWIEVNDSEKSDKPMHYCPKCQKEMDIRDRCEISDEELNHKYLISYTFLTNGFDKRYNFGSIDINLKSKFSPSDNDYIIGKIKERCNLASYSDVRILSVHKYE